MQLLHIKDKIFISFSYSPQIVNDIKTIYGRKYNPENKTWEIPIQGENLLQIQDFIIKYKIEIPESLSILINQQQKLKNIEQQNFEDSKAENAEIEILGIKGILYPFQKAGVKYAINNKKIIIGDQPGLGKSCQAIVAIHHFNAYPNITLVPNNVKYKWRDKEWQYWVDKECQIIETNDKEEIIKKKLQSEIIICNYNTLSKFIDLISQIKFQSIICDESHFLKEKKTKRTQGVINLLKKQDIPIRLLLTGTVSVNKPKELISQLEIIDRLNQFGGWWEFAKRYCNAHYDSWGMNIEGATNLEELHNKLRNICYVRRNKKDVLKELPDKQSTIFTVDISNSGDYKRAENDVISYLKGIDPEKAYLAQSAEQLVQINVLKKLSAQGKIKEAINWIEDFLESDEKLVVTAFHSEIIDILSQYFKCNQISGKITGKERDRVVQDFMSNSETKIIILSSHRDCGIGIDLFASSDMLILELGWTVGEMVQLEDRLHRIGQKNACNYYYMMGKNTIDIDIYNLLEEKKKIVETINRGGFQEEYEVKIVNGIISKLLKKGYNNLS